MGTCFLSLLVLVVAASFIVFHGSQPIPPSLWSVVWDLASDMQCQISLCL